MEQKKRNHYERKGNCKPQAALKNVCFVMGSGEGIPCLTLTIFGANIEVLTGSHNTWRIAVDLAHGAKARSEASEAISRRSHDLNDVRQFELYNMLTNQQGVPQKM